MAAIDFKVRNIKTPDGVVATVAEVSGSIDATTINQFQTVMDKLVEKGAKNLILDSTNVKYINSTGLGTLLKYVDTFGGIGGNLVFVRVPSKVMLVMEMLGFNALFNIYEDENEALRYLGAPAVQEVPAAVAPVAPAAPPAVVFPAEAACGRCGQVLRVTGAGAFRCPRCGQLAEVSENAAVAFPASRMPAPAELTLPANPAFGRVVAAVAGALARTVGMNGATASKVEQDLAAVFEAVARDSYQQDATGAVNVLILPTEEGLRVDVVDNGAGLGDVESLRRSLTAGEVTVAAHPVSGNVYTVVYNK